MCLVRKPGSDRARATRQEMRRTQREVAKLERKVRRSAERTLRDERIPRWIRDVKRRQLAQTGLINEQNN